ncbi:MAG: amidohydrolase family protein [Rhodothermales bacterium]|nr:amidohydrolase family protein [Rhodothermales bacterium]
MPAGTQSSPTLLVGAMAHLGTGQVIPNAAVGFVDGKITVVAPAAEVTDRSGYDVVDVAGMHLYPGLILPNTTLGLNEVSSVAATVDQSETGQYNPNVRALVAYNTDSELIPTLRFNGILLAQATPTSGVISGSSSIVKLDGWNWEDAVYSADDAIHLNWPQQLLSPRWWLGETAFRDNDSYDETVDELDKLFTDAIAYEAAENSDRRNLKLEALEGLFDESQSLHIHAGDAKSIIASISFAEKHGVRRIVVVGGEQAMLVAGLLVEKDIPVVLANVHRRPSYDHEDTVSPYKLPAALAEAGVKVSLGYSGTMNSRNLPFFVGTAITWGADPEDALKMVTANTAEVLGIADRTGTVEVGKDANIIVSKGDVFDMRTNDLVYAYIMGSPIQLDGRQQALYKKYSNKYGHND